MDAASLKPMLVLPRTANVLISVQPCIPLTRNVTEKLYDALRLCTRAHKPTKMKLSNGINKDSKLAGIFEEMINRRIQESQVAANGFLKGIFILQNPCLPIPALYVRAEQHPILILDFPFLYASSGSANASHRMAHTLPELLRRILLNHAQPEVKIAFFSFSQQTRCSWRLMIGPA